MTRAPHIAVLATLVSAAALGLSPSARAEEGGLGALSPQQRLDRAVAKSHRRPPTAQSGVGKLDLDPPQLTSFAAGTAVNLDRRDQNLLTVDLRVFDKGVGVTRVDVAAQPLEGGTTSAAGEMVIVFPINRGDLRIEVPFQGDAQPGPWQVTEVNVYDANDNVLTLDASALAALGNTRFNVVNRHRIDGIPPSLIRGAILTPIVSRSAPPRGEYPYSDPRAGIQLQVADEGNPVVSGLGEVYLTMCAIDGWNCIYMAGNALKQGAKSGKMMVGGTVWGFLPTGAYTIRSLEMYDRQGNFRTLTPADVDFDALFGGDASINVTD